MRYVNPEEFWLERCRDAERLLFEAGGMVRDEPPVVPVVTLGIPECVRAGL